MIKDDDESTGSGLNKPELTNVDLGEDLLEFTRSLPGVSAPTQSPGGESVGGVAAQPPTADDQIHSARILLGEGITDEAKRVLRQVLLSDPSNVEAKKLLQQIHESELKQIFSGHDTPVRKSFTKSYDESILDADSEEIVRILDRDFQIGGLELATAAKNLSFFSDARLLAQYADKVDREVGESAADRMDLAIGFIEMGLHPVAIRLLQVLLVCADEERRLTASNLAAYAHLMNAEPYRAIAVLQPVLNDAEIEKSRKTESFYLMGRAQQTIGAYTEALGWLLQAQANEPGYRDSAERIARCRGALSRKR